MAADHQPDEPIDLGEPASGRPSEGGAPAAGPAAGDADPMAEPGPARADAGEPSLGEPSLEPDSGVPDTVEEALAEAEAAVLSDLDLVKRERDDYLDALRRLQADFENFRKRMVKQQTDTVARGAQTLVEKLLPVLDAADLAVAHGADEAVGQIAGLLMDTLVKEGLEGVDPKPGEPFDPTQHEAVAHEPGEEGGPEVIDVLRAGYRWKGTLLRPAMVKVRG